MTLRLAICLALFLPACAVAQEVLPALLDLKRVREDQVVSVYAHPDLQSDPIGFLPTDAKGVEVIALSESGAWAQINTPERAGWIEAKHLEPSESVWERRIAPDFVTCFGRDRRWWLNATDQSVEISVMSMADYESMVEYRMTILEALKPPGRPKASRVLLASNPEAAAHISIVGDHCSMFAEGFEYGLSVNVLLTTPDERILVTGCCSLVR